MRTESLAQVAAYDYDLPEGRIARYPAERRDESRLLVVEPAGRAHRRFRDLPELLREGDLLVVNESRVLPVRLLGHKPTGAAGEVLLLRPAEEPDETGPDTDPRRWEALVRPGSKLKPGRRLVISDGLEVVIEDGTGDGGRIVRLESGLPVREALERWGELPLPPYMERREEPLDRERYQTVYARVPGSVAAPTAGLHFTPSLLERIDQDGVERASVVLHVGPGTFRPVQSDRIEDHLMHSERWELPASTARAIARTRRRGGRVWAVGTTVVRTLEAAALAGALDEGGSGETDLFIAPGFEFRAVDALVTNFHLPRSTLLMLVAAFAGYERTMAAYESAVRRDYRFYSYGDAMAIPARSDR